MKTHVLIAIKPPEELRAAIIDAKDKSRSILGYLPLVNDPPHCTLNLNNVTEFSSMLESLTVFFKDQKPPTIVCLGLSIFPGEQESVLKVEVEDSKELQLFQIALAEEMKKWKIGSSVIEHQDTIGIAIPENIREAGKEYGYPYIGTKWKGHFTIAYFPNNIVEEWKNKFNSKVFKTAFTPKTIELYLDNNGWKHTHSFQLKN